MTRHLFLAALSLVLAAPAAAQPAADFPNRPIRIVVPQAAGSGVDLQARAIALKMGELWGHQGVVENRPGANAIIGMEAVARANPDGYTLVYAPVSSLAANQHIYKKLSYDPLKDFAPITQTVANPLGAIANPASGIKSLKDVVERAKTNPGSLNYGSMGVGNMTHLQGVLLSLAADIKMTHVPYRGQTPMVTDILGGQVPFGFTTTAGVVDLVDSGKLTLLATFGQERDPQFPNTPTPYELGFKQAVVVGWAGLLAPAGTPKPIVDKLHAGVTKALASGDVKDTILKQGSRAEFSKSPDDFARFIKAESDKFQAVVRAAGLEGSQ